MSVYKTLICVEFTIDKPWAVGAVVRNEVKAADGESLQLPIQRRPDGYPYLPATSLVGSLRAHLGKKEAIDWLGSEQAEKPNDRTTPSQVRAGAAFLAFPQDKDATSVADGEKRADKPDIPIREVTRVAIDASRKAADANKLFTTEYVPAGTKVRWWLELDQKESDAKPFIDLLTTWRPVVGRGRQIDQGWAQRPTVYYRGFDLSTVKGLNWWLTKRTKELYENTPQGKDWSKCEPAQVAEKPVKTQRFEVVDALHLGTGKSVGNKVCSGRTVPSTSWRGVFRHRIEHILTVQGKTDEEREQREQIVERLFGSARGTGDSSEQGRRGILRFESSPVEINWDAGPKEQEDDKGKERMPKALPTRTCVAIDRISGGALMNSAEEPEASGGSLFTVEYLPPGSTLTLVIHADEELKENEKALLDYVIADLNEQIIGIGGMTTRGFGSIQCCKEENSDDK